MTAGHYPIGPLSVMNEQKKKQYVKRLYDLAFTKDISWNNWFFDHVYHDDNAMLIVQEDTPLSCLILEPYTFKFHNEELPLAYFSGITTYYKARGRGYMRQLLTEALRTAFERGYAFSGLIPAERHLFFLYDRFGFATVIFNDIERYTSLHRFANHEGFSISSPDFETYSMLEKSRPLSVIHNMENFVNILGDIEHDEGIAVQATSDCGKKNAIGFATASDTEIHVSELLFNDEAAKEVVLGEIKNHFSLELPVVVKLPVVEGNYARLRERGMLRIINVEKVLNSLAAQYPEITMNIRIRDDIIEQNNGFFSIKSGRCVLLTAEEKGNYDISLDVTTNILTKILFSSETTGKIFGIPAAHPVMALMLD